MEARSATAQCATRDAIEAAERALGNNCSIFAEQQGIASAVTAVLILFSADELDLAQRAAGRALEIARERDATAELAQAWMMRGIVTWGRGDLVAAESDLHRCNSSAAGPWLRS
jgi:hypothetical protein